MQKRIWTVTMAVGLVAIEANAASLSLDELVACAGIPDSSARLACYDRQVAPFARQVDVTAPRSGIPGTPGGPPAPPALAPSAPAPAPRASTPPGPATAPATATSSFGQENLAAEKRQTAEDKTLHARLTSQKAAGGGFFNLYLDNGQVWRHEDQVLGAYLRDGDAVTIEKGALGSYKLSRDEGKSRNWIRVTRVR